MRMKPIELPKQFIILDGKPVLVYTLQAFEKHPDIDNIVITCLDAWIPVCEGYVYEYGIQKVNNIVPGGNTGQASIKNALDVVETDAGDKDLVLVHDGVRPLISQEQISQCVQSVRTYGNAVPVLWSNSAMMVSDDQITSDRAYDRWSLFCTQTPQGFYVKDLVAAHQKAFRMGITNSVASCTLITETGGKVYFCQGDEENIKITQQSDLKMVRAILMYRKAGEPPL